ncbi:MAG: T9SS type A sorting domain-containing protein [Fibrobacterota bacterium]|nr:T9SS type A sorting domain-containing protein [Chitinispirillaceae bacterium]
MLKRLWKCAVVQCLGLMVATISVQAQTPYFLPEAVGYAAGVTGGGTPTASNTVTVKTASELAAALSGNASVILVSGSITTERIQFTGKNKSIIGLPGAKLINLNQTASGSGILSIKENSGSTNIIIRNITFVGPGAYDEDGWDLFTNKGCTKLWVDHCEFQDGMDGNFDNTNTADNITISWCKFTYLKAPKAGGSGGSNDHRFSNLVGGSDDAPTTDGLYNITWLNCWWANGCVDRMARARNAKLDFLNCYWNSNVGSKYIHLSPGKNGTFVYVSNGVFTGSAEVVNEEKTGNNNVTFSNCTNAVKDLGTKVAAPTYSWSPTPAANVVSMVTNATCGAGATLQVTPAGIVSSGCGTSDVLTPVAAEKNTAPVVVDNDLNVNFSASCSDNASATFFTMSGQKVYTAFKTNNAAAHARNINPGVYFVKMMDGNRVVTGTFVKK